MDIYIIVLFGLICYLAMIAVAWLMDKKHR
jgi:hypothetical protein